MNLQAKRLLIRRERHSLSAPAPDRPLVMPRLLRQCSGRRASRRSVAATRTLVVPDLARQLASTWTRWKEQPGQREIAPIRPRRGSCTVPSWVLVKACRAAGSTPLLAIPGLLAADFPTAGGGDAEPEPGVEENSPLFCGLPPRGCFWGSNGPLAIAGAAATGGAMTGGAIGPAFIYVAEYFSG
jgi:hypothetical protein